MDIDRPLDDIVEEKRAERRKASAGRGGNRGRGRGGRGDAKAAGRAAVASAQASGGVGPVRNRYAGNAAAANNAGPAASIPALQVAAVPLMADGSKIIVSNLPQDVTEHQIRELFTHTIGPVTKVQLAYDKGGKSTGVATIDLKRPGDAQLAFTTYNRRVIDNDKSKPMKVEILFDPTRLPPPPLNSRIAPAPKSAQANVISPTQATASGRGRGKGKATEEATEENAGGSGRGGRGGRRRGRGGKGGSERPAVTAADLDAEMEQYQNTVSTAPAA